MSASRRFYVHRDFQAALAFERKGTRHKFNAGCLIVLVILLTPVRMNLKDGGSVRYKALVYEVTKIHRLAPEVDGVKPYIDGFEIKILGMTVYRETNE